MSFGMNLNAQYTFVFIASIYSSISKQSGDYYKWRPFPAANNSLVNNAWSHINNNMSVYLASTRSFLLFLYFLLSSISHPEALISSPRAGYLNITPHHPFHPAHPTVSQLLLSHVNKWWPSWHDCKLVCFLWDESQPAKIKHSCSAEGHICACVHTADP